MIIKMRFAAAVVLGLWLSFVPCRAQVQAPKLRLPTTVRPVRYSVDLTMTPGEDHFQGSISIELQIVQPLSTIWLHGKSLKFDKATLRIANREETMQVTAASDDFVAVTANRTLPTGRAVLRIAYSGEISRTLTDGAFEQQQGKDWYIFTKFEPVTARRVFPCFDEPSFKVPWQLTLHVPKNLKAFSNTAALKEQDETKRNENGAV